MLHLGDVLFDGLKDLANIYPGQISNVRGRGTFCAFDCTLPAKRDRMIEMLRLEGISSNADVKVSRKLYLS